MEIINIAGYTEIEKLEIVKDHLLPKQIKEHGLKKSNLRYVIRRFLILSATIREKLV
nr:hypothetical protein [Bacillus subtilis]